MRFDKEKIFLFGDTENDMKSAVENQIIPVLIDPMRTNRDKAELWRAKYYDNFEGIEEFFAMIGTENEHNGDNVKYF